MEVRRATDSGVRWRRSCHEIIGLCHAPADLLCRFYVLRRNTVSGDYCRLQSLNPKSFDADYLCVDMTSSAPFPLRALVFATVGAGIVSAWLRPIYELFVVHGGVLVPAWWIGLHFVTLMTLFVMTFVLRKRHRRLCTVTWCAFWISVLSYLMPTFVCC